MKKIAVALSLMGALGCAFAQTYVGATLGATNLRVDCGSATSCDKNDVGYKLYGGAKLSRSLAGEVSYLSFGKAKFTGGAVDYTYEAHALVAAVALSGEITPELTATVRVGMADVDSRKTTGGAGGSTESHLKGYAGLGASYALSKNWWAVASADFTEAEYAGVGGTVRLLSLGVQYNF